MSLEDYNRLSPIYLFDDKRFKQTFSAAKTRPKKSEYETGEFTRYFVIRKNTHFAVEVDIFNKNKSNRNPLYEYTSIQWKISGMRNDVYKDGMLIHYGVEEKNQKVISDLRKSGIINIDSILPNPLEYWRGY